MTRAVCTFAYNGSCIHDHCISNCCCILATYTTVNLRFRENFIFAKSVKTLTIRMIYLHQFSPTRENFRIYSIGLVDCQLCPMVAKFGVFDGEDQRRSQTRPSIVSFDGLCLRPIFLEILIVDNSSKRTDTVERSGSVGSRGRRVASSRLTGDTALCP